MSVDPQNGTMFDISYQVICPLTILTCFHLHMFRDNDKNIFDRVECEKNVLRTCQNSYLF